MKFLIDKGVWHHNLKISIRFLSRNFLFTSVNVTGLVLGIIAFFILLLYYVQETSYDTFFQDQDKIFRVAVNSIDDGYYQEQARAPIPLKEFYQQDLPGSVTFTRMIPWPGYLKYGKKDKRKENLFVFADPTVLEVFPLRVLYGSLESFSAPFKVVILQSKSLQYFGNENPIGKTLIFEKGSDEFEFEVVAVVEDLPFNTHLSLDFIASIQSMDQVVPWHYNWFYPNAFLYAKFDNKPDSDLLKKVGEDILKEKAAPGYLEREPELIIQPLTEIHLSSDRQGEWKTNNTKFNINFYLLLGAFILLFSIINYVNLITANSQQRTKEIGVKKAMGSSRIHLIKQFFVESFLLIIISIWLSVVVLALTWDLWIKDLLDASMVISFISDYKTIALIILGVIAMSCAAGVYPALAAIRFHAMDLIRSNMGLYMSKGVQRKILVTVQFSISMFLILFTMMLVRQYFYMQNKELGFDKEYCVALKLIDSYDSKNYHVLKDQLLQHSFVENVAVSSAIVGLGEGFYGFNTSFPNRPNFPEIEWHTLGVDEDYLETLDIDILSGRGFDNAISTDEQEAFILNKAAANQLQEPIIGEELELTIYTNEANSRKGKVIGIVEDFHYESLHETIKPLIIYINKHPHYTDYLNIKLNPNGPIGDQISTIEKTYSKFNPDKPMELLFINDELENKYQQELAASKIIFSFTILSIFIAALGSFGLTIYSFRRRAKEIGIRKILGASSKNVTLEMIKENILFIGIACLVAWPVIYFISLKWLNNFAYAINFGALDFLLGFTFLIAIILVSNLYQIVSSIKLNPVDYLKNE